MNSSQFRILKFDQNDPYTKYEVSQVLKPGSLNSNVVEKCGDTK